MSNSFYKRVYKRMIFLIVVLYTVFYIYYKYYKTVFNPSSVLCAKPEEVKEIVIRSGEHKLRAWERINNDGPLLLYFHGNNLNLTYRSYVVSLASLVDFNVLLPDYRGFGLSTGYSTVSSFQEDAIAVYNYAQSKNRKIILWGESLGGYAASYCSSLQSPYKLVLFNTFSNIELMTPSLLSSIFLWFPNLDTEKYLRKYYGSALIIHSRQDTYIPFSQAQRNLSFLPQARFLEIEGDHSTPFFTLDNFHKLLDFLEAPHPQEEKSLQWINNVRKGFPNVV